MASLFPVKREMAILFFVKRDLDPSLPPSGYSQLGAWRLVGYLPPRIQRGLME